MSHSGRVLVAAVERPVAGLAGGPSDHVGQVDRGRGLENAFPVEGEDHLRPLVKGSFDQVPLTEVMAETTMDRSRPHDRYGPGAR